MRFWRRRRREPGPGDVIRLDGKLYVVMMIEWPSRTTTLRPLGDTLALHMIVDQEKPVMLFDALVEAGWDPPEPKQVVMTFS